MGISVNGQLCYGVAFAECFEFPWGDRDIEDWWTYTVHGFKHSAELFDHYEERRAFDVKHRMPVVLLNYWSGDYPMYVVAVPSTVRIGYGGAPTTVDPASLVVTDDERAALLKFFDDYGIETSTAPAWLLTSCWRD